MRDGHRVDAERLGEAAAPWGGVAAYGIQALESAAVAEVRMVPLATLESRQQSKHLLGQGESTRHRQSVTVALAAFARSAMAPGATPLVTARRVREQASRPSHRSWRQRHACSVRPDGASLRAVGPRRSYLPLPCKPSPGFRNRPAPVPALFPKKKAPSLGGCSIVVDGAGVRRRQWQTITMRGVVDDDVARRRPPSADARMQNVDGGHELHDVGMSPKLGAGRRDTYTARVAFPSSHALFTGRARKSSSAMAARQRKYGMLLTGALVLFVYVASYGLGRREDQRRDMHSDGTFSAPVGYSTKGIDFRHAFLQREADNKAIMHQIHKQAAAASEAAGGAAGVLGPAGEPSTSSSPVAHPTMHPRSSVGSFASAKSAGGIPLPPLIVASKEGGQPHGLSGHAADTGGLPQGQGRGGMMHGLGSWLRAGTHLLILETHRWSRQIHVCARL